MDLAARETDLAHCRFGRRDFFLVIHPDLVQRVLVSEAENYVREEYALKGWSRRPRFPRSAGFLPSDDVDRHLRARRVYAPAFKRARLDTAWPTLVDLTEQAAARWPDSGTIDACWEIRSLTASFLAAAAFGAEPPLPPERLLPAVRTCLSTTTTATSRPRQLAGLAALRRLAAVVEAYELLAGAMTELIEDRRREGLDGDDALSLLLRGADESGVSDEDVLVESLGYLFAGIETTAAGLAWILFFLARDRAALAGVRAEAERTLSTCPPTPGEAPYTYAVFNEALRLYPPSWRMPRAARVGHSLGGREIRTGAHVWISQYVVHRDARWYAEPDSFRPERWLDGSLAGNPRLAFIPFGAGHHKCLGEQLAWREFAAIVPVLAQQFDLSLSRSEPIRPITDFVIQPDGHRLPLVVRRVPGRRRSSGR